MMATIDINKTSEIQQDPEVTIRIKFSTGREIRVNTRCSDIAQAMMGVSEVPVSVSTRNVEINIK